MNSQMTDALTYVLLLHLILPQHFVSYFFYDINYLQQDVVP